MHRTSSQWLGWVAYALKGEGTKEGTIGGCKSQVAAFLNLKCGNLRFTTSIGFSPLWFLSFFRGLSRLLLDD
jgi:hypothetical protein